MAETKTQAPAEAAPKKDKAASFKKLANTRVTKALNAIAVIGNLSSKASYEYTPEQVAKIFEAVRAEVDKTEARLKSPNAAVAGGFSLD